MTGRMIWRNLWRNPRRTWITTLSITFAVFLAIAMQSMQKGIFDNLIQNVVGYYTGFAQVHASGYWDEQTLEHGMIMHDTLFSTLSSVDGIEGVVPRLETFMLASAGTQTKGCLVVGTDPEKEDRLTQLQQKILSGSYIHADDKALLLGEGLSQRLSLSVGDTLVLFGQGHRGTMAAGKYPVKGIVHLASPELNDNLVYLPLQEAQYLLGADELITSLALELSSPDHMNAIVARTQHALGEPYEVMSWKDMMPDVQNYIRAEYAGTYIFSGILYLIIAFGFFGTILMMTTERRYEFGMLMAIGMKKRALGGILYGETLLITAMGVVLGCLISLPVVFYFKHHPVRFTGQMARAYEAFGFEALIPTAVDSGIFITQSLIVVALALLIGLYPLWHIRSIEPVKAMK